MEDKIEKWLQSSRIDSYLKQKFSESSDDEIQDMFYQNLPFGTGGMRGIIGLGINRMNLLVVSKATRGLCEYLLKKYPDDKKCAVVVGYDNRLYSKEFAEHTAEVLSGYGLKVYLFNQLSATPLVSYGVRKLNAQAGIVITASHNPPEYNGYKIYDETGCQMLPVEIEKVKKCIDSVENVFEYSTSTENIMELDETIQSDYIKQLSIIASSVKTSKRLKIGFSPQHGTAKKPVQEMFNFFGFKEVVYAKEQMANDPYFTNTESANPEDPISFQLLKKYGHKYDLDVLITTDPDADRVGVAFKNRDNEYDFLNGNQLGALLIDFFIKFKKISPNSYIVKTIVTSELGADIAKAHGVDVENVLTGFKYIGDVINRRGESDFLCGYEESYGYLIEPITRDKDGIQIVLAVAIMADYYKDKGKTLGDRLIELYNEFGYYGEKLLSWTLTGLEGKNKIIKLYDRFRDLTINKIAYTEDYESSFRTYSSGEIKNMNFEKAKVLKHVLEDGSWLCARPSGTEPKLKIYIGAKSTNYTDTSKKLEKLEKIVQKIINDK